MEATMFAWASPPLDMPHESVAESDDPVGNPSPVHEVARENESGNAEEHENINARVHFLRDHHERDACHPQVDEG